MLLMLMLVSWLLTHASGGDGHDNDHDDGGGVTIMTEVTTTVEGMIL